MRSLLVEVLRGLVLVDQENEPSRNVENLLIERVGELSAVLQVERIAETLKGRWVALVSFWHQLKVRTCFLTLQVFFLQFDLLHHYFQQLKQAWVL